MLQTSFPSTTLAILSLVGALLVWGCERVPNSSARQEEATTQPSTSGADTGATSNGASDRVYSPFGLRLRGFPGFDVISFKSVGFLEAVAGSETLVFEGLAQSVRRQLEAHPQMDVRADVYHDESLADPANHKSCDRNHIYVDVWHSSNPRRFGYSLWSGCGQSDRFAWHEVPASDEASSIVDQIAPLARDIADRLADEQKGGCFQREC